MKKALETNKKIKVDTYNSTKIEVKFGGKYEDD